MSVYNLLPESKYSATETKIALSDEGSGISLNVKQMMKKIAISISIVKGRFKDPLFPLFIRVLKNVNKFIGF